MALYRIVITAPWVMPAGLKKNGPLLYSSSSSYNSGHGAIFAHINVLPPQKQLFKNNLAGAVTFYLLTCSILLMSLTIKIIKSKFYGNSSINLTQSTPCLHTVEIHVRSGTHCR